MNSTVVTYDNGKETIVTTPSREVEVIRDFFSNGKRKIEDYNRITSEYAICISSFSLPNYAGRSYIRA